MTKISPCSVMIYYAWKRIGYQVSTYQKIYVNDVTLFLIV